MKKLLLKKTQEEEASLEAQTPTSHPQGPIPSASHPIGRVRPVPAPYKIVAFKPHIVS